MRFAVMAFAPLILMGSSLSAVRRSDESDENQRHLDELQAQRERVVPFRLMSAEREQAFRDAMPDLEDESIARLIQDPHTLFYTDREIPRAYQQWDGALPGVHSPSYNISADDSEPFGNGNLEFPWGKPAGTEESNGVETVKFLSLPQDDDGKRLPVVWYRHLHRGDDRQGYAWVFPMETVIGECLFQRTPSGERLAFEVRLRTRKRYDWEVEVFRPFPTSADLAERIQQLRPAWEADAELQEFVTHLQSPNRLESELLSAPHPNPAFRQRMGVDLLPPLDDALVEELIRSTTFRASHGVRWTQNERDDLYVNAPTTKDSFHIIPPNYSGGFIDVDETSCLRCHETVGRHVRRFEFGRDWYGRIRGSDGIFSFHPFSHGSISYNGYGNNVSIRRELVDAGIVAQFDADKHPTRHYRRMTFVGE